ncbi:DUF2938 domain-containing protein [Acuticoccus kandeliae]|uniref:DUF2938 domain-containing protein n=1 Tax=Acuticoccus kandeliae TaxID=2073160 RepID=UPI000D3ED9B7|nr:DUF2938 domain-containing protein [Acuticoccus kandeliae]
MLEFIVKSVLIGAGATALFDLWGKFLYVTIGIPMANWGMVGRWFAHLPMGKMWHDSIAAADPVAGERLIGWVAHYAIGILYAAVLILIWGLDWTRSPTLVPALIVGIVTVSAGWFILSPGVGNGIAGSKTPNPTKVRCLQLAAHTVFGLGLYFSALLVNAAA